MAAALLTMKYLSKGHDVVAAGFLVFAIAEAVLMSGTAAGPAASVPAFAAGTIAAALYVRQCGMVIMEYERTPARDRAGVLTVG
jgi:hypothetical protein